MEAPPGALFVVDLLPTAISRPSRASERVALGLLKLLDPALIALPHWSAAAASTVLPANHSGHP